MSFARMQPTFFVQLSCPARQASQKIRQWIQNQQLEKATRSVGNCIEFFVPKAQQRFWSPHLSVQIHDTAVGSELVGKFAPRPEIWTMVMFLYGALIFVIFAGAMLGWSQWIATEYPWGFWTIPLALLGLLLLHTISWIGQQWSRDQMEHLRDQLKEVLQGMATSDWQNASSL